MNETLFFYGNERPEPVTVKRMMGQPVYTINVFIGYEREQDLWKWVKITLPPAAWGYGEIVNAIISTFYPSDVMQAVQNNYLLNMSDPEAQLEFNNMQWIRKEAKAIAKQLLEYAEEHNL